MTRGGADGGRAGLPGGRDLEGFAQRREDSATLDAGPWTEQVAGLPPAAGGRKGRSTVTRRCSGAGGRGGGGVPPPAHVFPQACLRGRFLHVPEHTAPFSVSTGEALRGPSTSLRPEERARTPPRGGGAEAPRGRGAEGRRGGGAEAPRGGPDALPAFCATTFSFPARKHCSWSSLHLKGEDTFEKPMLMCREEPEQGRGWNSEDPSLAS